MFLWHAEESLLESLFVEIVSNETDRPSSDKQAIAEITIDIHSDIVITHLECDHHIDQHRSDVAIDIEDEIRFLLCRECFDCECEVECLFLWHFLSALSQELTSTIRIVDTFYLMSYSWDDDALFFHSIDKVIC